MKLSINFNESAGAIKPMNAVNNGPIFTKNADQNSGNMEDYAAANIPFARTHDAAFCASYGGEHTVDITAVFPNFDADEYDPASYDFHYTAEYCEKIMMAGTKVFFRLGQKIEHGTKKYGIWPPKDFKKWAVICEHLIAHLNEGWADGYHMGIEYWEIWNEPDLYGKCWMGTPEEFYELYAITAKHLKSRFPHLKIGGPAVTGFNEPWLRPFFQKIKDENIPFDFYSWHRYCRTPAEIVNVVRRHRALLDEYGFTETESILNEWNYVKGWGGQDWIESLDTEVSMKGAAFIAGSIAACQYEPLDMLMYYDARPCGMNGMFSLYHYKLLKGYFPIKTWGEMRGLGEACPVSCDVPDVFAAAAKGEDGKLAMITYYSDSKDAAAKTFIVETEGFGDQADVYLLDETHDMTKAGTLCGECGRFTLTMQPNTVVVLK